MRMGLSASPLATRDRVDEPGVVEQTYPGVDSDEEGGPKGDEHCKQKRDFEPLFAIGDEEGERVAEHQAQQRTDSGELEGMIERDSIEWILGDELVIIEEDLQLGAAAGAEERGVGGDGENRLGERDFDENKRWCDKEHAHPEHGQGADKEGFGSAWGLFSRIVSDSGGVVIDDESVIEGDGDFFADAPLVWLLGGDVHPR